jgi:two-component system chemotaxis response regulator CheB
MGKIRVLVAEDSATVRNWLVEKLELEPSIDVIGEAEDGRTAIEICMERRPDVITMDLAMPGMDGLLATEHIMAHCPTPILIVSASENRGEVLKAYDALAAGAVDILEKPSGRGDDEAWAHCLLTKITIASRIRVIMHPRARFAQLHQTKSLAAEPFQGLSERRFSVVAIGASTGGPAAILNVLRRLPAEFDLPILVVLHVHPSFTALFSEWLASQLTRPVIAFAEGMALAEATGGVVVAPGGGDLVLRGGRLHLTSADDARVHGPSIDALFESIAESCGASAIACLLTGMGRDGASGLLKIRRAGGVTIAQDATTSVVYGMPREAIRLGAAQRVLPIDEIGGSLAASWGLHAEASL